MHFNRFFCSALSMMGPQGVWISKPVTAARVQPNTLLSGTCGHRQRGIALCWIELIFIVSLQRHLSWAYKSTGATYIHIKRQQQLHWTYSPNFCHTYSPQMHVGDKSVCLAPHNQFLRLNLLFKHPEATQTNQSVWICVWSLQKDHPISVCTWFCMYAVFIYVFRQVNTVYSSIYNVLPLSVHSWTSKGNTDYIIVSRGEITCQQMDVRYKIYKVTVNIFILSRSSHLLL